MDNKLKSDNGDTSHQNDLTDILNNISYAYDLANSMVEDSLDLKDTIEEIKEICLFRPKNKNTQTA